jgi:outer membrane lipoprotein SlyB
VTRRANGAEALRIRPSVVCEAGGVAADIIVAIEQGIAGSTFWSCFTIVLAPLAIRLATPSIIWREQMLNRISLCTFAGLLAIMLTAGQASGQQPGEMEIRQGVIEQITPVQIASNHHRGIGAVVGGLGGLGIGSLIGGGTGRDVAMVVGTLGGALMGNNIQKKYDQPEQGQQIIVRVTSGVLVAVTQPVDPNLRVGQRVYIEGNGEGARVVRQ